MEGLTISIHPSVSTHAHSRLLSTLPTGGAFVTLDKPTLMYHYHPESLVYIRVQSCIHVPTVNYINSTIQDSFTALKISLSLPVSSTSPPPRPAPTIDLSATFNSGESCLCAHSVSLGAGRRVVCHSTWKSRGCPRCRGRRCGEMLRTGQSRPGLE